VAVAGATALVGLIHELHAESVRLTPALLLDLIFERTGYRAWVAAQSDGPARLGQLAALRALAAGAGSDLGTWLDDLQLLDDPGTTPDERERVLLTTIHGAK